MYQLTSAQLSKLSRLMMKLNYRTCSVPIHPMNTNPQADRAYQLTNSKLPVRTISLSAMRLMQEKPNYEKSKKEEVLFGEIEKEESELKKFLKKYGKIGLAIYLTVSVATIGILYELISMNVDVHAIVTMTGMDGTFAKLISKYENGSKFIVAYCISKVLLPFRLGASLTILGLLKYFKIRGL